MSDLELILSVPKTKYAIGEYVEVAATIRNHRSQMVPFPNLRDAEAPQPVYQLKKPDGTISTFDPSRPDRRIQAEQDRYFSWMIPLQPGASTTGEFPVEYAAPVNQSGEYTVSARFKWRGIDLVAESIEFSVVAVRISDMSLADNLPEPGVPAIRDPLDPQSWGDRGNWLLFQITTEPDVRQVGQSDIAWKSPIAEPTALYEYFNTEWPLTVGGESAVGATGDRPGGNLRLRPGRGPEQARLLPVQCPSDGPGDSAPHVAPYFWTTRTLRFGWNVGLKDDAFEWFQADSPKPIAQGLRVLFTDGPRTTKSRSDVFVVLAGEAAELGHLHIEGVYEKPTMSALRPIAALGPGWVAAQAIVGPAGLGKPKLIASIARHEAGTRITFLRVESNGAISGKAERVLTHMIPVGPVAMQVRATGAVVEAAFPVKDARTGDLHVVRVKAPVALTEVAEPVVLPAIHLPEPTPRMLVAFSWFGAPFPQGVGLLMRQPGDKAFFWTEQRGLKPLPFTLHDQDEALILGKRSAWYVLVNNGIQVRGEKVESFFDEYRPRNLK